jgi:NAD-dependent dihydropyrimidine dehydrogenase PreA subunit
LKSFRYIEGVATVSLDRDSCVGCSMCINVCPHQVFSMKDNKAIFVDKDGCMECGACAANCPVGAINVTPGVGCASLIINRLLKKKNISESSCC